MLCPFKVQEVLAIRGLWGNQNPQIGKPIITKTFVFGSRCPIKCHFMMLIDNFLPSFLVKVATFLHFHLYKGKSLTYGYQITPM